MTDRDTRGNDASAECDDSPDQIMVTRVGLRIPERMNFEAWRRAGTKLARVHDSSVWCLGDWVAYGEEEYTDRYLRVIESVDLEYQTLRNYAWVARRFDLSRRRDRLSFQHHAEVASLPSEEQDRWLDLAEENAWSRNRLRQHLRANRERRISGEIREGRGRGDADRTDPDRGESGRTGDGASGSGQSARLRATADGQSRSDGGHTGQEVPTIRLQLQVNRMRVQQWQTAAARSLCDLEDWVVDCLDSAAGSALVDEPTRAGDRSRFTDGRDARAS